jgi:ubiquitin carboxyl-terminal hydrolase 14
MVRFTWRRDINKKAKIMVSILLYLFTCLVHLLDIMQRKVKFPNEYDALDLATDELREKMQPVARKRIEIEKARDERRKVRKRTRAAVTSAQPPSTNVHTTTEGDAQTPVGGDVEMSEPAPEQSASDELRPEEWYREQEKAELEALIDPSIKADVGASQTGLYDLIGGRVLLHSYRCDTLTKSWL